MQKKKKKTIKSCTPLSHNGLKSNGGESNLWLYCVMYKIRVVSREWVVVDVVVVFFFVVWDTK